MDSGIQSEQTEKYKEATQTNLIYIKQIYFSEYPKDDLTIQLIVDKIAREFIMLNNYFITN